MPRRLPPRRRGQLGPPSWYLPPAGSPGPRSPARERATTGPRVVAREAFQREAFRRYAQARGLDAAHAEQLYRRWASNPAAIRREVQR